MQVIGDSSIARRAHITLRDAASSKPGEARPEEINGLLGRGESGQELLEWTIFLILLSKSGQLSPLSILLYQLDMIL